MLAFFFLSVITKVPPGEALQEALTDYRERGRNHSVLVGQKRGLRLLIWTDRCQIYELDLSFQQLHSEQGCRLNWISSGLPLVLSLLNNPRGRIVDWLNCNSI